MAESREITLTMHRIDPDDLEAELPDVDTEVMIYDAELDDVVFGYHAGEDPDDWKDSATDERLPQPTWWADKPYPEG